MTFNKHMTNEELLYKLNYAYTCNQENFHKVLEITKERLDKLTELEKIKNDLENIEEELGINLIALFDNTFIKMTKQYIEKKPFVYAPRKKE